MPTFAQLLQEWTVDGDVSNVGGNGFTPDGSDDGLSRETSSADELSVGTGTGTSSIWTDWTSASYGSVNEWNTANLIGEYMLKAKMTKRVDFNANFLNPSTTNTNWSLPTELTTLPSTTLHETTLFSTDEEKWSAVLSRNPLSDHQFVYCVHTTKIYCRPTCPSRRPTRSHVTFALSSSIAKRKGYRPCRRCLPDGYAGVSEMRQVEAVEKAKGILHTRVNEGEKASVPTLEELAKEVGMSKYYFQKTFKKLVGESPDRYARGLRLGAWSGI